MTREKRNIWGWAMYDWANSAFATTVMAGFFPVFFKQYWSYGADINMSTARLGFGNSLASLVVALMAPLLGAIADRGSAKKKFLIFFAYLGILMTAALFMIQKGDWGWAILIYTIGIIGFSGSNIFYDALLTHVAGEENVDHVSGLGFGMGYLGGGLLFLINVLMTQMPEKFGLADAGEAVRYSFLSVAVWWGAFTLFVIFWVDEEKSRGKNSWLSILKEGFGQLAETFRKIKQLKSIGLFLIAYWLYIDGVDTIIKMAVDYGLSLGFNDSDLILALLITQFVAFPAAILYSKLGESWGVKNAIFLAIGIYMGVTLWGMMMTQKIEFYGLAIVIGLVQGGIQALSRSFYSRLIPKEQSGEFFGFYNMLGKFASIIGPALMGIVGLIIKRVFLPVTPTDQQILEVGRLASRWSIGSILLLFIFGALLFYFVDEKKGREEAAAFVNV